jgi:membrane fusion protein (multidrug efflux system)
MSKKLLSVSAIAVVIVAMIVTFRFLPATKSPTPESRIGNGGSPVLSVYTHTVTPRLLKEKVTATGVVLADEAIELTAETSGRITSLNINEGARVAKGDLLVKINDAELQAERARARNQAELARVQADRQKQLLGSQGASQESYDVALNELRVREAEVKLIEARIQNTEIRAPFDGTVGLRQVSIGGYLTPNTRIATLQSTETLKIDFAIPERYMDRLEIGGTIAVTVAGLADAFNGSIYAIEPRIDEATRTLRLRARANNPGGRVIPGAFATVEIALREIPDAIVIPAGAIIPGLNEKNVFVLEDGKARPRKVETGLRLTSEILVLSGIKAGDIVITSGQLQLRPGMAVTAVKRSSAEIEEGKQP